MATSSTITKDVCNVGMDAYKAVTDRVATTGANTCIAILVLFKNHDKVFIEHRFTIPSDPNAENVKKCFEHVYNHIKKSKIKADISSVYILGGNTDSIEHQGMQNTIQDLMKEHNDNFPTRCNEIIQKIKWTNVTFNLKTKSPETTGECNISVIVNPSVTSTQIALAQYLTKLTGKLVEKLIGVMMLDRISETISFAVVDKDANDQDTAEQRYHADSIMNFKNIMLGMHGVELSNDDAKDLIKQVTDMENEIQDKSDDEAMSFNEEEYD